MLKQNIQKTLADNIPEEELSSFYTFFQHQYFPKNHLICAIGQRCDYLYYILKGAAYMYYINENGEKIAIQFAIENYWINDLYSFLSGNAGIYGVETLEPCEVLTISKTDYLKTLEQIPFVDRYFRILTQNAYVAQQYRITKTNSESATHRYNEFVALFPQFLMRIPQYLIASYLGIKPQSLSRIRRQQNS